MNADPKARNAFVTEGISADAFRIEARKRAESQGITTTIHFHSYLSACGEADHEVIKPEESK